VVELSPSSDTSDTTSLSGARIGADVLGARVASGKLGKRESIIDKPVKF